MMTRAGSRWSMAVVAVILGIAVSSTAALGQGNPNPRVLPPNAKAYGKTYGEWGAAWWNWALSSPVATNPLVDETGAFCDTNQSGPVWFLAGTLGGDALHRACTVPSGKALFFPIINTFFAITEEGETEQMAREFVNDFVDGVTVLEASLNEVPLTDLERYRAESPTYTQVLPEGAILDELAGVSGEFVAVADGFWLLLSPLPVGEHVIHFRGVRPDHPDFGDVEVDVTYVLTVAPGRSH